MPRFTSATARQFGRRGGLETHSRHGSMHMEAIGRAGYRATLWIHHYGDARMYGRYLADRSSATTRGER